MLHTIPYHTSLLKGKRPDGTPVINSHLLIYGSIEIHSAGPYGCIASNKRIGEETNLSTAMTSRIISELDVMRWIKVVIDEKNHRTRIDPLLQLTHIPQEQTPATTVSTPLIPHAYIDNNTDNNKITIKPRAVARAKKVIELKNDSKDVNAMILYFYSKLVPAEQTSKRFMAANRTAMDNLLSTYGMKDVHDTIDKAKELLGKPYKPQIQTIGALVAKYEQIRADKIIKPQTTRL